MIANPPAYLSAELFPAMQPSPRRLLRFVGSTVIAALINVVTSLLVGRLHLDTLLLSLFHS